MVQISLNEIEARTCAALIRHGAQPWIAEQVARAVRKAESVGNRICGLYYLESYCQQLQTGRVKGDVEPEVTQPRPGAVLVDAKFGFAQPAFARGIDRAAEAARACGVASLARHDDFESRGRDFSLLGPLCGSCPVRSLGQR